MSTNDSTMQSPLTITEELTLLKKEYVKVEKHFNETGYYAWMASVAYRIFRLENQ